MSEPPQETRPPTVDDLVGLARELNARGALYIVIGGMAMLQQGMPRYTDDIDFLYETSRENQRRFRAALSQLPDRAILELAEDDDWTEIGTIRVNDVITVDLMPSACGVEYTTAKTHIEIKQVQGVDIPFADARLLLETKRTWREKDQIDSSYPREKIAREETNG